MKTNHPRAQEVARELGVKCAYIAQECLYSIDCGQMMFDECLEEIEADGQAPDGKVNYAAYDRLQNEGYTDTGDASDTADEFYAGRE